MGISNTFVMVCAMILIPIMLFIAYQFVQMLTKEGAEEKEKADRLAAKKAKKEKTVRIQKGLAWLDLALYLDSSSLLSELCQRRQWRGRGSLVMNLNYRDRLSGWRIVSSRWQSEDGWLTTS